jgi:hypothetical protein
MKAQKKALATDISSSVESLLAEAGDQSKKIKKLIKQSAKKLAAKLIRVTKKESKKKVKVKKAHKAKPEAAIH